MSVPFRRIVVPYDGSDLSEMAVPFARALARLTGGSLLLVRALPEPRLMQDIPSRLLAELHATAEAELAAAAGRASDGAMVETLLKEGFPAEVILRASAGRDLVVMTTHGRGGVSRIVLGSVAEKLIRLSQQPVLVVRPRRVSRSAAESAASRLLRDILVPLDGSELSRQAVAPFAAIPEAGTRIHLLSVVARDAGDDAADERATWLAARAAVLEDRDLTVVTRLVRHDDAAEAIASYAENRDCGLIVMSTHGKGGWKEWMLGSTTDKVIRRGPVPVMVVRPPVKGPRKS